MLEVLTHEELSGEVLLRLEPPMIRVDRREQMVEDERLDAGGVADWADLLDEGVSSEQCWSNASAAGGPGGGGKRPSTHTRSMTSWMSTLPEEDHHP